MNRIAILFLFLIVAALALLLLYRSDTRGTGILDQAEIRHQPLATLDTAERLIGQARDGVAAADQARETLNAIIDSGSDPDRTLQARQRLVELERLLGNNKAASDVLLDIIQAHPGSGETPQMLFDLGLLLAGPLDRSDEAGEIFKRVVNLYPNHTLAPEALIRLARIRMSLNPPDSSGHAPDLRDFSRANPGHPLADEALWLVSCMTDTQETDHE